MSTFEEKAAVGVVGVWLVGILAWLVCVAGIIAIIVHFVHKFW